MALIDKLTAIADAVRSKTGNSERLTLDQMAAEIGNISTGGSGSDEEWIGDGKTHLWITLQEARKSPVLGVAVNGTVTVDWGDGTTPDTLTGVSLTSVKCTNRHEYASAGDYVITLSGGEIAFYRTSNSYGSPLSFSSSTDNRKYVYQNAVKRVEIGKNAKIDSEAFRYCYSLDSINIPDGVTSISSNAFRDCYSLKSINIPESVTSIGEYAFERCCSLNSINIPEGVTSIGGYTFRYCYSLESVNIPESVTSIGHEAFRECYSLESINIPDSVTSIGEYAFNGCYSLESINIPEGVMSIGNYTFGSCRSLTSVNIPSSVTSIDSGAFNCCYGCRCFDFSKHTKVPTLADKNAFNNIPADCEIRVPAALVDEWKAATNWATYADKIVGV